MTDDENGLNKGLQVVDPAVTKTKFEKELYTFKSVEEFQRKRGVILLRTHFPQIVLAFCPVRLKPRAIAFAVRLDFTNYDLEAPSLKFVDALTEEELLFDHLDIELLRNTQSSQIVQSPIGPMQINIPPQNLIQFHNSDKNPFVCLPGLHEYHVHAAHSNDSWLLHRSKGEGTLGFIIDQLYKYGSESITAYNPEMTFKVNGAGNVEISIGSLKFMQNNIPK